MEQHPVPQPITSYEFRLVGDMTLRQFAKLASGLLLALLVYAIDPPGLIKWFLISLFVLVGFGMAFVPYEGRPIDIWIIAFFKRIYSPTQYIWRSKDKEIPSVTKTTVQPVASPVKENIAPLVAPVPQPVSAPPVVPIKISTETILKAPSVAYQPPQRRPYRRVEAIYTPGVVVPATPTLPNLLVGFVRTKESRIIEAAILEIRDMEGLPVRAFKTNKLGQFLSATPLPSGEYEIETEKEGLEFDIIKVKLTGKIMPPIEIVSKN